MILIAFLRYRKSASPTPSAIILNLNNAPFAYETSFGKGNGLQGIKSKRNCLGLEHNQKGSNQSSELPTLLLL